MRYLLLLLCIVMAASASAQVQYLGSPTTTVRNRGNFVSDSLFYLPKRQKLPTDTGAIRYAISDSSVYVWTGYQWNKLSPGSFVAIGDTASMLNPYTRGSGTVNYLPKFTGARTFGNSIISESGNKISIGSTTYPAKFHVIEASDNDDLIARFVRANSAANDQSQIEIYADPVNNTSTLRATGTNGASMIYQSTGSSPSHIYQNSGSEVMRINSSGNVGIAKTNPIYKLEVSGSVGITPTAASSSFLQYKQNNTNLAIIGSDGAISGTSNTDFAIYVYDNNNLDFWTNFSRRLRLTGAGELLIGTTSDAGAYALQVAGSIYNTTGAVFATSSGGLSIGTTTVYNNYILNNAGASQPVLALQNNGTGSASTDGFQLSVAGNHAYIWNYENALMLFGTNGTERMRIQADGELLLGGTTDAGTYALQVTGNIYNTGSLTTGAPSGGSIKPWKIGEAATVSPTSPNRTIRVEIDGTVYYIHAKTTND